MNSPPDNCLEFKDDEAKKRQSLRIKSHEAPLAKPKRKRISPDQFRVLSDLFEKTDTPNYELRERMAGRLNMTNREVQVWFQNRRAKATRAKILDSPRRIKHRPDPLLVYPYSKPVFYAKPITPDEDEPERLSPCNTSCSSLSSIATPTFNMSPIDLLATAAEYVQRCDDEKRQAQEAAQQRRSEESRSWRPWL
ncbi:Homeodomain-like DNA binding domain-containing transcription factor [Phycomyces blakesleeanus NRRL 1555(-)]|uniref:Homeodomain-like DNA binding domain-containing transcription factor n=2 Tax=Phycomyces blakesleeanus TaxID=4837 RepID=A0A167NXJ1_PHYB8|nr:Homeodomain-like DNA binding domain-containing transcription factor [Phycomyces blakesleeanus NRRL 1555(-)]OAD76828.1 Homeodomain-like DNA binding domain-containing transcription factor [Phycomyces blakesleeanus NRRL 1555(-)]|eukprot:XP_018294868.1 Homeodomain-like DNA binding domain-containing transcription factor [Phycomyces blakesleeanus NRRL 1555(-)]